MLPFMALMMVAMLSMAGFAVDTGRIFYIYRQLQASTDLAALAGAAELPQSDAVTVATNFSSVTGALNARSNMAGVTMVTGYPKVLCLNTLSAQGMSCTSPATETLFQVRQEYSVPLTFMRILGKSTQLISTTATASTRGAARAPYNVAIIVVTTGSMGSTDSDSNCGNTRLNCALAGVQTLLQNLSPCSPNQVSCGPATNGNVTNPVDRVALYTFPALASAADAQHEYDCSGTQPKNANYTDPTLPIYQVLDYSSDFKTSATTGTLNPSSNLVKAVHGVSGCTGMQPLPMYTYIAGAMYKAGTDLINSQSSYPNSQSVVIILTDGDMEYAGQVHAKRLPPPLETYASTINQCAQAVNLATYAAALQGQGVFRRVWRDLIRLFHGQLRHHPVPDGPATRFFAFQLLLRLHRDRRLQLLCLRGALHHEPETRSSP